MAKDIFTADKRSRIMAKIGPANTRPEILLRKVLHKIGLRFRKNLKSLPGTPDIVFPKYNTVVFVHGCFWHRHDCNRGQSFPKTRPEFWRQKFGANVERDRVKQEQLTRLGWKVLVVWECELKQPGAVVTRILRFLDVD